MKSSIAWTAKDGPKTDRLEVAGVGPLGDTLIKHQFFEVETLTSDNALGTLTRTLDFTWASRCRLRVAK
jgi:hypothetical protein